MPKKIRALRQFSHYHLGTIDGGEEKTVRDDIADVLVEMELAELVDVEQAPAKPEKPVKAPKVAK
ncbi:hypothetical protein M1D96_06505 [Pseudomonas sp. D1-3]